MSSSTHLAAVIPQKGGPLALIQRPTPTPGPNQLLIQVKAVAINPVDYYQRELGVFIENYPAICGSDVAGIVAKTGSNMRPGTPKAGDRVVAFASAYLYNADPDYGAYQEYVLISEDVVSILPGGYTFVEGSVFPMAAWTTWNGWLWAGMGREYRGASGEGVLIWGASSSVGAFAVQEARLMGLTVYATAGVKNHEYIKGLGATKVFDYREEDVLGKIVDAAKEDGVVIRVGYHATGSQQLAVDVLSALGQGLGNSKLAIAPIVEKDLKVPDGVETTFVLPPNDIDARNERTRWIFGTWLQEKLASKEVVASPYIKVVEGGLASANRALDEWKAGVSCTKIVFEV
ncbi:hypothetical protein N7520_007070 [Penicillium odoratum]|uniref:uncharacterized protein n=1 Tax=Penicillium odoratum TaxID=1167516 RepID=UPI002548273F|nr:uncharacterized protein N7520_007070 [Penicillium odoratum]KAJ5759914.1 hypothetical protein N7520_007070 [Penicillium odoratum]